MTSTDLTPASVHGRMEYAKALAASNLLPDAYRAQPANVLLAIEYGHALGLEPIAAIQGISVIKGKPTLSADLMAAVVRRAGHKLRVREEGMSVTATLIRRDDPDFEYTVTWDQEKAQRAGLWGQRGPWVSYPTQMLRSRAITEVCRQGASEALSGAIYAPDELATVDVGEAVVQPPAVAAASAQSASSPAPAAGRATPVDFIRAWLDKRGYAEDPEALAINAQKDGATDSPAHLEQWLSALVPGNADAEVVVEEAETSE